MSDKFLYKFAVEINGALIPEKITEEEKAAGKKSLATMKPEVRACMSDLVSWNLMSDSFTSAMNKAVKQVFASDLKRKVKVTSYTDETHKEVDKSIEFPISALADLLKIYNQVTIEKPERTAGGRKSSGGDDSI